MSARRKTGRGTRAAALALAAAAAFALVGGAANSSSMVLASVRVGNGGMPFAGDGPRNVTVSPNGDGLRDYPADLVIGVEVYRHGRPTEFNGTRRDPGLMSPGGMAPQLPTSTRVGPSLLVKPEIMRV